MDKLYYVIFELLAGIALLAIGIPGLVKAEDKDNKRANLIMIGAAALLLGHFVFRLCTGYLAGVI